MCMYIYIYTYTYVDDMCVCIYVYIYIYIGDLKTLNRETIHCCFCLFVCLLLFAIVYVCCLSLETMNSASLDAVSLKAAASDAPRPTTLEPSERALDSGNSWTKPQVQNKLCSDAARVIHLSFRLRVLAELRHVT